MWRLPDISKYDEVFTLNYYEFWDESKIAKHLHGYVELEKMKGIENVLYASAYRMKLREYMEAVELLSKSNNIKIIDTTPIIFAPSNIEKNDLVCVSGVFPSDKLYPANDIFLKNPSTLYKELLDVNELDVFGVSPYGDDSLIKTMNRLDMVRVYIYKKKQNKQAEIWNEKLTCIHEILDSEEID